MKNILCSLLLLTSAAHAQNFQLGLSGGIGYNTAPSTSGEYYLENIHPSDISVAASLKFMYVQHNWQYGFSADYAQLSYKSNYYPPFFNVLNGIFYRYSYNSTTKIADPGIPAKLFVNKQFVFHRLETYGGISAGYVTLLSSQAPRGYYEASRTNSGNGWLAGLQIGGTQFISKHLGINAELSASYMSLDAEHIHYELWYIPVTLGIRYKL